MVAGVWQGWRVIMMTVEYASTLEDTLSNNSFTHGSTYKDGMAATFMKMHRQIKENDAEALLGINIDTGANRSSVMSQNQYVAYQKEFGRKIPIRQSTKREVEGNWRIGGFIGESHYTETILESWINHRRIFQNNEERVPVITFQQRHVGEQFRYELVGKLHAYLYFKAATFLG